MTLTLYLSRQTLPFNVEHKVGMAVKVGTYFVVGFGLPFFAAAWHRECLFGGGRRMSSMNALPTESPSSDGLKGMPKMLSCRIRRLSVWKDVVRVI